MNAPRRIGILGGMGPQATVLLMQRLIDAVAAADDRDHIPLLVDCNTQVPSRIAALIEGTGPDPGPVLEEMARRLEAWGAEALAMPCNTAHHYAERIAAAVSVPFLDMVRLSARAAATLLPSGGRVGILGSPALRRIGVLDRALRAEGLEPLHPEDEAAMLEAIRAVKREGPCEAAATTLRRAAIELRGRGAELQLVACTEFSLLAHVLPEEIHALDTLDVLVDAIVDFAGARRRRPPAVPSSARSRGPRERGCGGTVE